MSNLPNASATFGLTTWAKAFNFWLTFEPLRKIDPSGNKTSFALCWIALILPILNCPIASELAGSKASLTFSKSFQAFLKAFISFILSNKNVFWVVSFEALYCLFKASNSVFIKSFNSGDLENAFAASTPKEPVSRPTPLLSFPNFKYFK